MRGSTGKECRSATPTSSCSPLLPPSPTTTASGTLIPPPSSSSTLLSPSPSELRLCDGNVGSLGWGGGFGVSFSLLPLRCGVDCDGDVVDDSDDDSDHPEFVYDSDDDDHPDFICDGCPFGCEYC